MHYVIGDVHGCYDEMIRLIEKIEAQDSEAILYFVGDFIDRGPDVWKVLCWAMEHITANGKYRSVRGNHEEMVIEWYHQVKHLWIDENSELPEISYGFDAIAKENNSFTKERLESIVDFFESLPLYSEVTVTSAGGKEIPYIIAHAFVPWKEQTMELSKEELNEIYLWSRQHFWGYRSGDEILVHGHTPTFARDYDLRGPARLGMIAYRSNCINVDGGCCYMYLGRGESYPCLLCAICLENLKEFYSDSLEERFGLALEKSKNTLLHSLAQTAGKEEAVKFLIEQYKENWRLRGYSEDKDYYREQLLQKLGLSLCSNNPN